MTHPFMRKLAGVTLGFSILATGVVAIGPTTSAYAASVTTPTAADVIATGQQFMGVRYQFGAKSGNTASFDCSSFVQYAFAQNGIQLPRSSRQQSTVGTFVPRDQLQPGDLVFFYSPIHHVAIYMGNGKLLHTYGAPGVTITDLNSGWWGSHYTTARRVLPDGQAAPVVTKPADSTPAPVVTKPVDSTPAPVVTKPAESTPDKQYAAPIIKTHNKKAHSRHSHHRHHHEDRD
jgi:murein DD-endopeptidase / murein LD-carboxypeptidase